MPKEARSIPVMPLPAKDHPAVAVAIRKAEEHEADYETHISAGQDKLAGLSLQHADQFRAIADDLTTNMNDGPLSSNGSGFILESEASDD